MHLQMLVACSFHFHLPSLHKNHPRFLSAYLSSNNQSPLRRMDNLSNCHHSPFSFQKILINLSAVLLGEETLAECYSMKRLDLFPALPCMLAIQLLLQ